MLSEFNLNWSHANNIKTRPWLNHGGFFCAYLPEGTYGQIRMNQTQVCVTGLSIQPTVYGFLTASRMSDVQHPAIMPIYWGLKPAWGCYTKG